jgi:nitrate/TMAO reductase-like tetraheme cytochrome c subunit
VAADAKHTRQDLRGRFGVLTIAGGLAMVALACAQSPAPRPTNAAPSAATGSPSGRASAQPSLGPAVARGLNTPAAPVPTAAGGTTEWPLGAATPSEDCARCHAANYREYAFGFGSDLQTRGIVALSAQEQLLELPSDHPRTGTAHSYAGVDPWPIRAREIEEGGKSCNVCHFPQAFELLAFDTVDVPKPPARGAAEQQVGITCAGCHLTPEGKMRGPYDLPAAPHPTVQDPGMQTSAACEYCHSTGQRVIGKQTQTYLEWREDFNKAGLGPQQCQDCHMPRTVRKLSENYDVPPRPAARHLWTGGHSAERLRGALHLVITLPEAGRPSVEFHVINVGAGHSVPTGSNRRAVYLHVEVLDQSAKLVASPEWMFAPNFADRPDDKAFVEADKSGPEPVAAPQADAQGPHEPPVRAGEERVLSWATPLKPGTYTVQASLIHDLNRYNDRAFSDDQTEMERASISMTVE